MNKPVAHQVSESKCLVDTAGFELLGSGLARDVEQSLEAALSGGVVFAEGCDAPTIFRQTLSAAIRNIESHPRGRLFQEFLFKGPYEDVGEIPSELIDQRLSDDETASAITFIYSYMVNNFKGAIAELLASRTCLNLLKRLKQEGELPGDARLYVGDAVLIHRLHGNGVLKGADMHILFDKAKSAVPQGVNVAGVVEVKSYNRSERRLQNQLDKHLRRLKEGLRVNGVDYPGDTVGIGYGRNQRVVSIAVRPSGWKLPRTFRFQNSKNGRTLHVDPGNPPQKDDEIKKIGNGRWRITLRWSVESLAEAAYEMTFWYMGKVGEVIYSKSIPKGWPEMSPSEAGRNAAKQMLYYAILRCRTIREEQRAIALYNSYGFGYALGMNFKNSRGRREMLWPQDLDEILSMGETKNGCILR